MSYVRIGVARLHVAAAKGPVRPGGERRGRARWLALVLCLCVPPGWFAAHQLPASGRASGVVIDEVQSGSVGAVAGLRAGDVLVSWRRAPGADLPASPGPAEGLLSDPWAFDRFETDVAPRSPVTIDVRRAGVPLTLALPARTSRLGVSVLPLFDPDSVSRWRRVLEPLSTESEGSAAQAAGDVAGLAAELTDRGRDLDAAWLHVRLAEHLMRQRAFDDAERQLTTAAAMPRVMDDTGRAQVVHGRRFDFAMRQSRWDAAAAIVDAALTDPDAAADTLARASWQLRRAAWLRQQGRHDDAQREAEAALAIRRALAAGSWDEADAVAELGRIAAARRRLDEAVPHFEQALAIVDAGPATIESVRLGFALADADWRRGRLPEAERRVRALLALTEKLSPDSADQAKNLNLLGILRSQSGDLPAASRAFEGAWTIHARLDPGGVDEASALNNLGIAAMQRGRYAEAESLYRRSLAMKERLGLPPVERASTYGNLGLMSMERRDLASARAYLTRALELTQQAAPGSLPVAGQLSNLARVERLSGRLADAERLARESLDIRSRLAPNTVLHAFTLSELGKVLEAAERLDASADAHRQALAIRERLAADGSNVADSLDALGRLAERRGDLEEAASLHARAGAIWQRVAPSSVYEGLNLMALARLDVAQNRAGAARDRFARAIDIFDELTGRVGGAFDTQADFRGGLAASYAEYSAFLIAQGDAPEAFRVSERARARVFLAMLAERDVVVTGDAPPALIEARRALTTEYERIQAELGSLVPARDGARIDDRVGRLREVRLQLAATNADIAKASPRTGSLRPSTPLDVEGARRALAPGTAAIAYVVGERRSHAFVLSRDAFEVFEIALGRTELGDRVDRLQRLIERRDETLTPLTEAAADLYRTLVAPAEAVLARHARLLIVPDGPLHEVPFAALVRETGERPTRQYLVEWRPVHQVPSLTLHARLSGSTTGMLGRRARLLAVGSPVYPDSDGAAGGNRESASTGAGLLPPLPGSRREVDTLRALYGARASVLADEQASEARVRQAMIGADVIHIAVHGLVNSRSPLDSALAFSSRTGRGAEDNGLLQAWEIFEQVRLRARLVVLSACDTAGTRESGGEGLLGLTRAFQFAGAPSVVASLWRVPDEATPVLMREFHRHLRRGVPVDDALARSQRAMLRRPETAHPYNWAAFILSGSN